MLSARRHTERTVLSALVQLWVMFGVTRGLSADELCAAAGFRFTDVTDRDRHVPRDWYVALRLALIERLPLLDVGIEIGNFLVLANAQLGYLGLAVQYCETPREALRLTERYVGFVLGGVLSDRPRLEDHGETVHWVIPRGSDDPPEATESHFIHVLGVLRMHAGKDLFPRAVRLIHHRERLRSRLQEYFGTEIEFGCEDSRVEFARADIDRPFESANAEARKNLETEIDRFIQAQGEPFVTVVTRVIESQLSGGDLSQSKTAKRLGVGMRTLQRRLSECGVTYNHLVDRARRVLAERLLSNPEMAVYEVAFALGYSDVGSFNRAWRRWSADDARASRVPSGRRG